MIKKVSVYIADDQKGSLAMEVMDTLYDHFDKDQTKRYAGPSINITRRRNAGLEVHPRKELESIRELLKNTYANYDLEVPRPFSTHKSE